MGNAFNILRIWFGADATISIEIIFIFFTEIETNNSRVKQLITE